MASKRASRVALTSHNHVVREATGREREGSSSSARRNVALLFLAGFLLHNADHFRRGLDVIPPAAFWAGTLSGIISLAAIAAVLIYAGRLAAPLAAVVGFGMAIGVSTVHLLPTWGPFSDSLPDGGVDAVTWSAVLCEIAGAFAFGWVGLRAWRGRQHQQGDLRRGSP